MLAVKEVFSEIETLPTECLPEKGKKHTQSLYGMFADTGDTLDKFLARKQAERRLENPPVAKKSIIYY